VMLIERKPGEQIGFGASGEHGVAMNDHGECKLVEVADVGVDSLVVHDEHRPDPSLAFALSRLASGPSMPTPIGVFRDVERPTYEDPVHTQIVPAVDPQGPGDPAAR